MPRSLSSIPAALSIPPSRNRSTPSSRWLATKLEGRARKLIVAGCLVERYRDEIQKNIPEVDAVVGTGELESILEAAGLRRAPSRRRPRPSTSLSQQRARADSQAGPRSLLAGQPHKAEDRPSFRPEGDLRERQGRFRRDDWQGASHLLPTYLYDENTPRLLSTPRASAYIKIAEGCDHPCTFCVIPNLRGKFRSRRFESVVAEAQQLVARGVQEITLIGQDTTCYGEDLGSKDGLATLLDRLARIDGLRWLRFLYAYPNRITGNLLDTIAQHDNICKYLDVPLQHASPDVLKRMKRGAGADIFLKTLDKVRAAVPGIALRTSFIVGFPGESLRDFEVLEEFIREAKFDWLGVFSYSDEEGSAAYLARRQSSQALHRVPPSPPHEAAAVHLAPRKAGMDRPRAHRPRRRRKRRNAAPLGRPHPVPRARNRRQSLHQRLRRSGTLEPGRFYRAEITEAHDYDVVARVVAGPL